MDGIKQANYGYSAHMHITTFTHQIFGYNIHIHIISLV